MPRRNSNSLSFDCGKQTELLLALNWTGDEYQFFSMGTNIMQLFRFNLFEIVKVLRSWLCSKTRNKFCNPTNSSIKLIEYIYHLLKIGKTETHSLPQSYFSKVCNYASLIANGTILATGRSRNPSQIIQQQYFFIVFWKIRTVKPCVSKNCHVHQELLKYHLRISWWVNFANVCDDFFHYIVNKVFFISN